MRITIDCSDGELFELSKSILLELRQQHEEDIRYGEAVDLTDGMVHFLWQSRNKEDAPQAE